MCIRDRKMIAESNSFIIGADYDIHKVVFTLIITAKDRITGYRFALESAGLPVDEKYIRIESTVNTRKDLNEAIPRILDYFFSLPDPPDALFGVNDLTAVDLYNALNNQIGRAHV